jgi:outer membrane protein assembly factor BamB
LAWKPEVFGNAGAAVVTGDRVIVGGDSLVSFNSETGMADRWAPAAPRSMFVEQVVASGASVFAAFVSHARTGPRIIAAFDARTGSRTWQSHVTLDGGVLALAVSDTVVVVGGSFGHAH